MISPAELAHWGTVVPWKLDSQVEQDLVLSRLIIEFAQHPLLGTELVFRGGHASTNFGLIDRGDTAKTSTT